MARSVKGGGFTLTTGAERVLRRVAEEPGEYVNEIARNVDLAAQSVDEILDDLEGMGHVRFLVRGKEHCYFAQATELEDRLVALVRKEEAWNLLAHVALRPGVDTQIQIAEKLAAKNRTVKKYADQFIEMGVFAPMMVKLPGTGQGIGYEVRWQNIEVQLGLFLAHLPPKSLASTRIAELLSHRPAKPTPNK